VLKLASFFLRRSAERSHKGEMHLPPAVAERLLAYDWPGNVRELQNAVERAVALAKGNVILPSDLPPEVVGIEAPRATGGSASGIIEDRPTLAELERRYIALLLTECGGNKKKAAERLGIDRRTLYRALERNGDGPADGDGPAEDEDDE
jgi:two-component system response regulator HydG